MKGSNHDLKEEEKINSTKSICQVSNFYFIHAFYFFGSIIKQLVFKLWISSQSFCCFPRSSLQKVWFPFYLKVEGEVQPRVTSRPLPFVTMHGWGALLCPFYFLHFHMHRSFLFCFLHFKFCICNMHFCDFAFCTLHFIFCVLHLHPDLMTPPPLHHLIA